MTEELGQRVTEKTHSSQGSYWPITLAISLTLAMVGLVLHPAIFALGVALCLAAILAWSVQRFQAPSQVYPTPTEAVDLLATSGYGAAPDALEEPATKSGRWGLIWFISTEAVFFANLIAAYLYLRARSDAWPPSGTPHLELLFPIVNTVILLLSGVPAYFAHRAIKKGDVRGLQIGFILAALLGSIFLAGQGYEYATVGFAPQTNTFAAGFFVLTGFHGAHVAAGVGLMLVVLALSLRGRFSARRNFAVEVAATYWHFVDVVWIFLFSILYLFG